jgi:hypothetical protein
VAKLTATIKAPNSRILRHSDRELSNLLSFVIRAICRAKSVAAMYKTFEQQRCQRIVKCTLSFDNRVFACLYRHENLRDQIELFLQFAGKLSELLFLSSFFRGGLCNISRQDRLAQVLKLID